MNNKVNEYREKLAETFLSVLEEKQLDWKKGWNVEKPHNIETGRTYRGINAFQLELIAMNRGYKDNRWATFLQVKKNGWKLQDAKGQGVKVEYWYPYDTEKKKAISWKELKEAEAEIGDRYALRANYTTVFNADLIEGVPEKKMEIHKEVDQEHLVEKIAAGMQVPIIHDHTGRAYYVPTRDEVHLPEKENFVHTYAYNSTALHELAHATGHEKRLNRDQKGEFGTPEYAYEELIAEITSCFLSSELKTEQTEEHINNHKAYVQAWIQCIREKPESLVKAVAQAEKAAEYMEEMVELNRDYTKNKEASMEVPENLTRKPDKETERVTAFLLAMENGEKSKMMDEILKADLKIGAPAFTINYNTVKEQEVEFGNKDNRIVVRFCSNYEPLQIEEPKSPIKQNLAVLVYQNDVPVKIGTLGGKESLSLQQAKENQEEMLNVWKWLTKQESISWDKDIHKAMQKTAENTKKVSKEQELER